MSPIPGIIASSQTGGLVTGAFDSIATVNGTGSSATISFTSIPSGYKSLQIRYIAKSTQGGAAARYVPTMTLNGASSLFASHALSGTSSTAAASGAATQSNISFRYAAIPNSNTGYANMFGVGIIDIVDYTSTSKNKTVRGISGVDVNAVGIMNLFSGLWYDNPTAITQIDITVPTGSWTTTSSFALYGVK